MKISLLIMAIMLASCTGSVSDFIDPFTDDARIECDVIVNQNDILIEMSRVAETHDFIFTSADGTVQDGQFIASMTDGPAQIFVTNYGFEGVTIIATFAILSNPNAEQRQKLEIVVEDLVNAITHIC